MTTTDSSQADHSGKLFVIGDLLIDSTFHVDVPKLSPEAPVPVAMLTGNPINTPGGAGLAAAFASIDNIPVVFGTYTSLQTATWITSSYGIPVIYPLAETDSNLNCIKTRFIDNERHYHLLRVDSDLITPEPFADQEQEDEWFHHIEKTLAHHQIKVLTLLDYRKGLLNEARSQRLIAMARNASIPVYVDSRCQNLHKFRGADILKLNETEARAAIYRNNCISIATLGKELGVQYIIETKGANGADLWNNEGMITPMDSHEPDLTKHEGSPDVTGCGDVFDVTFCYHWSINKVGFKAAIRTAVERATRFAYEPIGERLRWQS